MTARPYETPVRLVKSSVQSNEAPTSQQRMPDDSESGYETVVLVQTRTNVGT